MGRETVAVCHWDGTVAEVKLHLDSKALTLRGDLRLDLLRTRIQGVDLTTEGLRVATDGPDLMIELPAGEAARWQKALLKKPPTLAEKLGVSKDSPVFVLGAFDDAILKDALENAMVGSPDEAVILMALLFVADDLHAASDLALRHPDKHIWMVHRKGKAAIVGDTLVRAHMRGLGFVDSKTSAVSDMLTTTRYRLRQPA